MPATFFITSKLIGAPGNIASSLAELRAGHELGNHTASHYTLSALDEPAMAGVHGRPIGIRAATGITPTTCAYPNGGHDDTVTRVAAELFRACRTTQGGLVTATSFSRYRLTAYDVSAATPVADVEAAIDNARSTGGWLNLVWHGVGPGEEVSAADFDAVMAHLQQ